MASSSSNSPPEPQIPCLDNFIDDLLTEILVRTPVETAHLCKTVSKRWLSLISDPYFARRYVLQTPTPQSLLIYHYFPFLNSSSYRIDPFGAIDAIDSQKRPSSLLKPFSFNFLPIKPRDFVQAAGIMGSAAYLAASCNGLLLCSATPLLGGFTRRTIYYVCNPITKKYVLLPAPPPLILNDEIAGVDVMDERAGFICDGTSACFDVDKARYKVVLFPQYDVHQMGSPLKIFCFSSESWKWSEFNITLPLNVFWSRSLSDISSYNKMLYGSFSNGIFVYYPYDHPDVLSLIDLPKDMDVERLKYACLGIVQGKMRLTYLTGGNYSLVMWELEDSSNFTWCQIHNHVSTSDMVPLCSHSAVFSVGFGVLRVINLSETDGDILYLFDNTSIFLCNMKTRSVELLFRLPCYQGLISNTRVMVLPSWPTPVPTSNDRGSSGSDRIKTPL